MLSPNPFPPLLSRTEQLFSAAEGKQATVKVVVSITADWTRNGTPEHRSITLDAPYDYDSFEACVNEITKELEKAD